MNVQQRQEQRRREKLEAIEQQIKDGKLVIRKMTKAERAKFPPRPASKKRARG